MALTPTLRLACRNIQRLSIRNASTSIPENNISVEDRNKHYPKIGTRDIVGYGLNGHPQYVDNEMCPFPAIRFREETAEMTALREREKGDWHKLSMDEKKALYRHSFCQTFSEMGAPTGEWKSITAATLLMCGLTLWIFWFFKQAVYPPMPGTITKEWMEKEAEHMVRQGQGRLSGISSKWDYEKNQWKD